LTGITLESHLAPPTLRLEVGARRKIGSNGEVDDLATQLPKGINKVPDLWYGRIHRSKVGFEQAGVALAEEHAGKGRSIGTAVLSVHHD
jgi:hypothetical protein